MQLVLAMSDNILYVAFSLKICFIISQGQICATDDTIDWIFEDFIAGIHILVLWEEFGSVSIF